MRSWPRPSWLIASPSASWWFVLISVPTLRVWPRVSAADSGGLRLVPVADAGFGQQMAGPGGVEFQLAAQPGHVKAQVVGVALVSGSPDFAEQEPGADELARVSGQDLDQPPFGAGEVDGLGSVVHGAPGHVDLAPPDDDLGGGGGAVVSAQGCPQPGEQFLHRERLADVVVGARVQGGYFVARAGAAGQHDDGRPGPAA